MSRRLMRFVCALFGVVLATLVGSPEGPLSLVSSVSAQPPKVVPAGQTPVDHRLKPLRDLNAYFPFEPSSTPGAWALRKQEVQRHLLVSLGLWPMPTKTPANAVVHGKVDRDDYTVERVFFESFPGFYVTGSLYRPKGREGRMPGVLCPHGHWANGRFFDHGTDKIKQEIASGAEKSEESGRSPLQARCVQLARMGCVVFHYDMIGYADSVQISQDVAHGFRKQRPELSTLEDWGLFSTQAEAHAQSVMGMQTYNSIRALDFLLELPDVDPQRIGVTGASGGGTQTFILGAIDDRPHVAFPAVMVSTAMQGGCTCENCSLLRVGTGNVEFAAMFAPRPLGMTAADDWTKEMQTKGFPELQKHYAMLDAPDNVMLKADLQFGHNYNLVGRTAMYHWFNKHLRLKVKEPIEERDYKRLSIEEMTVWSGKYAKPESGPDVERRVLGWWTRDAEKQLAALRPTDTKSLEEYRRVVGGAVESLIGRGVSESGDHEWEQRSELDQNGHLVMAGVLRYRKKQCELPVVFAHPKNWNGRVVVWLTPSGKSGLFTEKGELAESVRKLVDQGTSVVGADLLYQGEFLRDGSPLKETPRVENGREFAGYTFGYNPTVFAGRVHDVLALITFVKQHESAPKQIDLVGLDGMGAVAAVAGAQARSLLDRVVVDTRGFRFGKLESFRDPDFLPGGAKYGDLPGIMALIAPAKLWVAGETGDSPALIRAAYASAQRPNLVTFHSGPAEGANQAAVEYLAKP
ncbi:MAG: hypothetical protein RIS70_1013 [Planctomycetota bacterium]